MVSRSGFSKSLLVICGHRGRNLLIWLLGQRVRRLHSRICRFCVLPSPPAGCIRIPTVAAPPTISVLPPEVRLLWRWLPLRLRHDARQQPLISSAELFRRAPHAQFLPSIGFELLEFRRHAKPAIQLVQVGFADQALHLERAELGSLVCHGAQTLEPRRHC